MCKRVWHNLYHSFSNLDTLLAWFAVFIWLVFFTQSFTGLDGFINFIQRATSGDWFGWKPLVGGVWYMHVVSVAYWAGLIIGIIVFLRLMRKLFTKHKEDESIVRIEGKLDNLSNELSGMGQSIDTLASEIRLERESRNGKTKSDESTK